MNDRAKVRQLLLSSRKVAAEHIDNIKNADSLTRDLVYVEMSAVILAKFHLDKEDVPADENFNEIVDISLSKSMQIDPSLVDQFDKAQSCDGATSAMAKKVLLFRSIEKAFDFELPATRSARVKNLHDVSDMIFDTLALSAPYKDRIKL